MKVAASFDPWARLDNLGFLVGSWKSFESVMVSKAGMGTSALEVISDFPVLPACVRSVVNFRLDDFEVIWMTRG